MSGSGSRSTIDEVRDRAEILSVVNDYVQLQKKGRYYVGLCPFHSEKTPSFTVTPERGIFHCFGCGEGGDAFSFIQRIENVGFVEAARILAERLGIAWHDSEKGSGDSEAREDILRINRFAEGFYERVLRSGVGAAARRYLKNRGITGETAALYHIGYAPPGTSLPRVFQERGVSLERLERAGLVMWGQNGHFDRFRDRIIFPIRDHRGRVVGFGGRTMGGGTPKYLNSAESPVFSKGRVLYGLDLAYENIRRQGKAFVVEGYMDAIALRQAGLQNVVASLGTAFTSDHARLLARHARDVFLAYDADAAGQSATLKGLDILRDAGLNVRIVELPTGEDPDTFVLKFGLEAFMALPDNGPGIIEFRLKQAIGRFDSSRPEEVARVVRNAIPVLAEVRDPVERDAHIHRLCASLSVSADAVYQELRDYLAEGRKKPQVMDTNSQSSHTKSDTQGRMLPEYTPPVPSGYPSRAVLAEQALIKAMSLEPDLAREIRRQVGEFAVDIHERFLQYAVEHGSPDGGEAFGAWMTGLDELEARYIRGLVVKAEADTSSGLQFDVTGCIAKVREGGIQLRIHRLEQEIVKRETRGVLEPGEAELSEILSELRELHELHEQLKAKSSPLS